VLTLLGLTKKANKKWAEMAINALKDLFCEGYLIATRKDGTPVNMIYAFSKNPIIVQKLDQATEIELRKAYYEHCIREVLRELLTQTIGRELAHNDLEYFRMFAMDFVQDFVIITGTAELTEAAISIVVNKLGDQSKKVQCHAIQVLVKMVIKYKSIVEELPAILVRELGLFLEKRCSKPAHRVYALGCLNKLVTVLVKTNAEIRPAFIQIYFS